MRWFLHLLRLNITFLPITMMQRSKNWYKERQIKRIIKKVQDVPRQKQIEEDEVARITLPCIKGTTNIIAKILRKTNINVTFSPLNTIKKMLDQAKDKVDPNRRTGVYVIPCSCGKEYIGETWRAIEIRVKEHCADIRHNRTKKSALAEHSSEMRHQICIENTKLLVQEGHYTKRKIKEALEIKKKHDNNINRDEGIELSDNWKPIINIIKNHQANLSHWYLR